MAEIVNPLAQVEEAVGAISPARRIWVLPILQSVEKHGGSAKPALVKADVGQTLLAKGLLSESQWSRARKGSYLGWARLVMVKRGLLTGEAGVWALTDAARLYLEAHREDSYMSFEGVPEQGAEPMEVVKETVQVTQHQGYYIPLLRILESGPRKKQVLMDELEAAIGEALLPGDWRSMPSGTPVFRYRASWALTALNKSGDARNPSPGLWESTTAGKERLKAESESWALGDFAQGQAKVIKEGTAPAAPADDAKPWDVSKWRRLRKEIDADIFDVLDKRLRPQLGATPERERDYVPRNVIFYGPPGTGKTFMSKLLAGALTDGPTNGAESREHIVQFHPSYAYEDFIQGLRPDLEQTNLRYTLASGPFLKVCEAASQDPDNFHVLIIDEINRGDPARIFGELLYGLEYRGQAIDLPLGGQLEVPPNLVIVGTMNSVDRSVALVDYALRRRFGFVRVGPDSDVIRTVRESHAFAGVAAATLETFNEWLETRLDADHTIGHSFFLNPAVKLDAADDLETIWRLDVAPLLEEYFFGDRTGLKEARTQWKAAQKAAETQLTEDEETASGDPA